jgi:acyl carrier protein
MGLESVELIMEFEKHLKLSIPDQAAENIWSME